VNSTWNSDVFLVFYLGAEPKRRTLGIYLVGAIMACILLVRTGHSGAMLVYQHGAGVQAAGLRPFHTEEELFALDDRLDPEGIFYSNLMHHVFGWLVLALSVLLFLDIARPQLAQRLRKLSPLLMFSGGIGLFIFSEPDGWPLAPTNPFLDREALLHKTIAILTTSVGALGLWRSRRKAATEEEFRTGRQLQHRTMAVFALIGGALLFTHIHTVGPYANRAVGIYLHHTVMGSVALLIGGIKLLEDMLPKENRLCHSRGWPYLYPSFIAVMAFLLIKYNEGLPWFLGYQEVNPIGPHGGLVAAVGSDRAEITFDPTTATLDLYLIGSNDARPRPVQTDTIETVLRVGTEATLVPLQGVPGTGGNAHFRGKAAFLRDAPAFLTQATIPRPDNGQPTSVEFEMWVDARRIAKPSKAAFVCPMHSAIGKDSSGSCPECGMRLVPNKPPHPADQLHDPTYKLALLLESRAAASARAAVCLASKDPMAMGTWGEGALPAGGEAAGRSAGTIDLYTAPRRWLAGHRVRCGPHEETASYTGQRGPRVFRSCSPGATGRRDPDSGVYVSTVRGLRSLCRSDSDRRPQSGVSPAGHSGGGLACAAAARRDSGSGEGLRRLSRRAALCSLTAPHDGRDTTTVQSYRERQARRGPRSVSGGERSLCPHQRGYADLSALPSSGNGRHTFRSGDRLSHAVPPAGTLQNLGTVPASGPPVDGGFRG
jgi:hypothetical protein